MFVVRSISQLEEAVRNDARENLIIGMLVTSVQEAAITTDSIIANLIRHYEMSSQENEPKAPIILTRGVKTLVN